MNAKTSVARLTIDPLPGSQAVILRYTEGLVASSSQPIKNLVSRIAGDKAETFVPGTTSMTIELVPPGGLRIPGDANGDGGLDISDAVATLGFLFLGSPAKLSCGDGNATDPANLKLVDWQADGAIDISDAVAMLTFLFLGGKPHTLAPEADQNHCVRIASCSDHCGP